MQRNIELRKVPAAFLEPIAVILDINEDWKRVMSVIPKDILNDHFEPKYNSEHMRLIEQHAHTAKLKCARVLFDEWGTSGRKRPTLQTLLDVLSKAKMIRAAEDLAIMLNESPPPRPEVGPEAMINTDVTSILNYTSGVQNVDTKKISNNCNGTTNGTYNGIYNDPTKKLDRSVNLMEFPPTQVIPNFEAMGHHSTEMIQDKDMMASKSNLIVFSEKLPDQQLSSEEYFPKFSSLMPNKETDSAAISETSQLASELTSASSQSSSYQTPSQARMNLYNQVDSEILEDTELIRFNYADLENITNKFTVSLIGSGGFGDVFVADHNEHGLLAIKRANSFQLNQASVNLIKIFNTEVISLSTLRHKNIVPILGYSLDGLAPCIVCEFIEGGSLLENIANKEKVLTRDQRMNIMLGTAEGLKYIHSTVKPISLVSGLQTSSKKAYFLHGDVKSANILLSKDCVPMLCDFGLSKQYTTTFHTESVMGTSAYMAPERFSGTITQKGDIFSYGIVLLELLTGLEPIISEDNEIWNIKMYVEEKCLDDNITSVLHPVFENWPRAQAIYELAKLCMKTNKNKRPQMDVICETLHKINDPA